MTTVRVQKSKDNPYVQMDKRPLNDERLTWKAKGILAYLLSKPDDWQVWVTDLIKRSKDGGHAVRTGLQELMEYGYATRKQERDDTGKYKTLEWTVYEQPFRGFPQADKQDAEKPQADELDAENRTLTNNDSTKSDDTDNDNTEKDNTLFINSKFDENGGLIDIPKPKKRYVSKCEYEDEYGNIEIIEDDSWKQPQKQIDYQALGACGRESFRTKKEYDKLRKIEAMLESSKLPEEFWRNRMASAEKHHWSFPKLLSYTLNVDLQRKWKRQQPERRKE